MSTRHIYIDETKERGYVLVASAHLGPDVDAVRKELRRLVLRGQQRIHMAKESGSRRKAIIDTVIAAGVTATVYDAGVQKAPRLHRGTRPRERLIPGVALMPGGVRRGVCPTRIGVVMVRGSTVTFAVPSGTGSLRLL